MEDWEDNTHDDGCSHTHRIGQWGVLDDHKNVVPIIIPKDLPQWEAMISDLAGRQVQRDTIGGQTLSTVFLGLNHGWGGEDCWFETAIFGNQHTIILERYATYAQALKGHLQLLGCIQRGEEIPDRAGL